MRPEGGVRGARLMQSENARWAFPETVSPFHDVYYVLCNFRRRRRGYSFNDGGRYRPRRSRFAYDDESMLYRRRRTLGETYWVGTCRAAALTTVLSLTKPIFCLPLLGEILTVD